MPDEKYFGMRITNERCNLLQRIAAQTGATYDDTTFVNLKRTEARAYITVICTAWGLHPDNRGASASAVDFALKMALIHGGAAKPKEGETALLFALRVTAEQVE